jgi:hypothetical protein
MAKAPVKPIAVSNPYFKLLLGINAVMWLATGGVMVYTAFCGPEPLTKTQEQLFGTCEKVFFMTSGAFIGLLGGRAATPDRFMPT